MFACLCLENEPQKHSQDGNLNNSPGNVLNLTVAIKKWVNMDINIDKETSHSLIPKTTLSIVHSLSLFGKWEKGIGKGRQSIKSIGPMLLDFTYASQANIICIEQGHAQRVPDVIEIFN